MKRLVRITVLWAMLLPALTMCGINGDGAPVSVSDIVVPAALQRSPVPVEFTLTATKDTTGSVKVQYRVSDDDPWRTCTPDGRDNLSAGLPVSPEGTVQRFIWDADADLRAPDTETETVRTIGVTVRVVADSNTAESEAFQVISGNHPPEISFSRIPETDVTGSSELLVKVYDAENDPVTVTLVWSRGTDEPDTPVTFVVDDSYTLSYITDGNGQVTIVVPWIDVFGEGEFRQVNIALHSSDPYGPGETLQHRNMTVDIPLDVSVDCTILPVIQRGSVTIPCVVYGPPYRYYTLHTLFRDPYHPEKDWQAATVRQDTEYFLASPHGVETDITWESASDLDDMIHPGVQVEVRLQPLGLRTLMSVAINNAPKVISMALSEIYIDPENGSFIELYGHPGFNLEGYAVVEVYKNGTYNLSKTAGFVLLPEDSIIPDDGFMVIGESEDVANVDIVDPAVSTFFKFGFPTNVLLFKPLDQIEYYDREKVKIVDAVALGTFTDATVFDGLCEFTRRRAEEQGIEDISCPVTAAAPQPEAGQSACRTFSNLDLGENNLDWSVCSTPSPGEGVLADPLQ